MSLIPCPHDAEMAHRDLFAVHGVAALFRRDLGSKMRYDLMAVKIEYDGMGVVTAYRAAEAVAVEAARLFQVAYRECEVEWAEGWLETGHWKLGVRVSTAIIPTNS